MKQPSNLFYHLIAFFTIFLWGTTFVSTKVLLQSFSPTEILILRFTIGYFALALAGRRLPFHNKIQEIYFMAAGFCGVTLYFLLENFALTYTLAANVGVIIAIAPFFTALFDYVFLNGKKPDLLFLAGLAAALAGVYLISFGSASMQVHPAGDFLAIAAAVVWAAYSTLMKKISGFGHTTLQVTRRSFFYGLLFMLPTLAVFPFDSALSRFLDPKNIGNLLFLGLGASALCFATWNLAVKQLGAVKTSIYIYLVPIVTVISSALLLKEPLTASTLCGMALTLTGVFISERRGTAGKPASNPSSISA